MKTPEMDEEFNRQLDSVIEMRRTVRSFTDEVPPRETVEQIIRAGLLGPYAAIAIADEKVFRRFFVFERGTKGMDAAVDLAVVQMRTNVERMKARCESDPAFAKGASGFLERLETLAESGQTPISDAPYYIVIAEKSGTPPVEMQSIAHVLENMWLKATALGLGVRLISMTEQMGANNEFCKLLGIKKGDFGLDGCTIGFATEWPEPTRRPTFKEAVTWMS
jgi:nitroreductase